jgi:EpsD family peptidyl-prolyl cis-trans isomerase
MRQQAIAKKLDRSPEVVHGLEAAKSEILARAYLAHIASAQAEPSPTEIRKFYVERPELFADRAVFELHELIAQGGTELVDALRDQVDKRQSMEQLAAWLKSRGVPYSENRGKRASEDIPMGLVRQVHAMAVGDIRLVEGGGRVNVFRLVSRESAPVSEKTASARIRQLLVNQAIERALANELAVLRKQSHVEYLGEFASPPTPKALAATDTTQPSFYKAVRALR